MNKQLHAICYLLFQIVVFSTEDQLPLYEMVGTAAGLSLVAVVVISMLKGHIKEE